MRLTIRSTTPLAATLSAVILLGGAAAAVAQPPAPGDHRGPRPMGAQMQAMREAHERQRAQDLRTILRLRPEQEPALTAYLASMKPPERPSMRDRAGPPKDGGALTTPQRLDEETRREAERGAMHQRHTEALRSFYAALTGEQRQVFDALQRMGHGGRGMGGHGVGGHGMGDWGHRGFGGGHGPMGDPPRDDE